MDLRIAGAISFVVLTAVTASCADKGVTNPGTKLSTIFALQVIAPAAQTSESAPQFLLLAAWYNTTTAGGIQSRVVIGRRSFALSVGAQTAALGIDIATCIADPRRAGPAGSCQFDVIAALVADTIAFLGTDSNFAERSWDFAWLQGLEARPGQAPTIPPIDLSLTRFDQPVRLAYKTPPPASVQLGTPISVEVAVEKAKGGIATTAAPTISLVLSGNASAQLGGQTTRTAANGVATFTGLTIDKAGASYVLTATTAGLASGNSASFAVTVGAAPPPPPPPPPPATVNAYDGTYHGSGVLTADDGSNTTYSGTMTASSGMVSFSVAGFTMTGTVALSGLITFNIAPDAAARCNPTAMTGQLTISASGVATMVASGSQNDRGISPTGGCIPGRLTYTFSSTRLGALQVAIAAGNGQTATVGSAVAIPPRVSVRDASNNPVAGANVTFAVASGGGSTTNALRTTDASGVATVGSWTLGAAAGPNTLTATVPGATGSPVTFSATGAASVPASISFASITAGGAPVNVASVSGTIDVGLSVNPGSQTLTKVRLLLGGVPVDSQTFTVALAVREESADPGMSGQAMFPQMFFTVNTAARTVTGALRVPSGPQTLTAQLYTVSSGTSVAASASTNLVLNNGTASAGLVQGGDPSGQAAPPPDPK